MTAHEQPQPPQPQPTQDNNTRKRGGNEAGRTLVRPAVYGVSARTRRRNKDLGRHELLRMLGVDKQLEKFTAAVVDAKYELELVQSCDPT